MARFKLWFAVLLPLFLLTLIILPSSKNQQVLALKVNKYTKRVCDAAKQDIRCDARVVTDEKGNPDVTFSSYGLGPAQFRGAYNLSGTVNSNQTIAIVDAYDDPNILSDLNKYSSYFGIPGLTSCPVASGTTTRPCFQKVNQSGGNFYPSKNSGWDLEIALDVETAHGLCQNCNILLVEANNSSYNNLMTAVDRAVSMGAKIVSNSYGSGEFSSETQYDFHFNKPGIAFTFSSGDSGYGTSYPAASKFVTAVGGTTLNLDGNTYLNETAWDGAGSGCSLYEGKPAWQTDTGCSKRTIADVSADADPNSGAAVYDSVSYYGYRGWFQVGGTSLASPIIAATYAYGGIPTNSMANSLPYANLASLNDITLGSNGSCSQTYLCNGQVGFDGPTGLGTPKGSDAF